MDGRVPTWSRRFFLFFATAESVDIAGAAVVAAFPVGRNRDRPGFPDSPTGSLADRALPVRVARVVQTRAGATAYGFFLPFAGAVSVAPAGVAAACLVDLSRVRPWFPVYPAEAFLARQALFVPVVHVVPVAVTFYDPGLPGDLVALRPGATSVCLFHLFAEAVSARRLRHLAGQAIFFLSVPDSVPAQQVPAADNGSFYRTTHIAALPVEDNDPPNTAVDSRVGVRGAARRGDPIYPNRFCVVPNRGPNDLPSAAAHQDAMRGNR